MNRREFLATGSATAAWSLAAPAAGGPQPPSGRFSLTFAPHFGMFRCHAGDDLIDQIRFLADQGFRAVEDPALRTRPPRVQERIGDELQRRGMTMGAFVATADFGRPTFAAGDRGFLRHVLRDLHAAVAAARRTGARFGTVVPGTPDPRVSPARQAAHAVDALKHCRDLCEPAGLTLLLEPMGDPAPDCRGRLFLRTLAQSRRLCRAVEGDACRILFDVYRESEKAADVVGRIDTFWDETGYVQVGDRPGRKEPGTGTLDLRGVFACLRRKGYRGPVGMEHGSARPGLEGEQAVISAYRAHAQA